MSYNALFTFVWQFICLQKWSFLFILILSLGWALDQTLWPYVLQVVIDILTQYDQDRISVWTALKVPVICGLFLWIGVECSFRIQGFLLARAIPKLEADMRMTMFDHVQRHSPQYFNQRFSGSLANKITDMTTQVPEVLIELLTLFSPAIVACLMATFLLFQVNILFAAILVAWICIHFLICIFLARGCDGYEHRHAEERSHLLGKIVDSLTNNFTVNLHHRFLHERKRIAHFQSEEKKKNVAARRYVEKMRLLLGLFTFLGCGVALHSLMLVFWMQNRITTGEIVLIFNTAWNVCMVVWLTGLAIPRIFQSVGIAKQALSIMGDAQDIVDEPHAKPIAVQRGEIVFENVSFHYGEKRLFQNKDVRIGAGERVGLVGYSGAGKSTFVNLILRFYPVQTGRILVDGHDISTVTLESLRRQIALIPQDPILFHRSLKENIHYGRLDATDEEVLEAARLAHCDEFIMRLPDGYQTLVGERGTKLSGGERQRIAIARAILADAPLLILDEATSALDSVTEGYIQNSLYQLMEKRTTLVIAHRLSTLIGMHRILVFDQGKIVEEGTHDELLAAGGHYAQMWQMQAGGFLP